MPHEQGQLEPPPPEPWAGCAIYLVGVVLCVVWLIAMAIVARACG